MPSPLSDGRVRPSFEPSRDQGETWYVCFDAYDVCDASESAGKEAATLEMRNLIEQHAAFPHVLRGLVQGVGADVLRLREGEGRWTPLEIIAHVADEEVEDFRPRAQAAAAGDPIPWSIDPPAWVKERKYNEQQPFAVLDRFTAEREASCAWLRALTPEQLETSLEHAQLGRLRCGDFVAAWRMHDLLHLRQLATALAVLTARDLSDWRTDYAGAIQPLDRPPPD